MKIPAITGPSVEPLALGPQYSSASSYQSQALQQGLSALQQGTYQLAQGVLAADIQREQLAQFQVKAWKEADESFAKEKESGALNEMLDVAGADPTRNGFLSLQGSNAIENMEDYVSKLDEIQDRYKKALTNDFQRQLYTIQTDEHKRRFKNAMYEHALKQAQVTKAGSFEGLSSALQKFARSGVQFDQDLNVTELRAMRNADEYSELMGIRGPAKDALAAKERQKIVMSRFMGIIDQLDFNHAEDFLEGRKQTFDDKYDDAKKYLDGAREDYVKRSADEAFSRLKFQVMNTRKIDKASSDYKLLESTPWGMERATQLDRYRYDLIMNDKRAQNALPPSAAAQAAYFEATTSLGEKREHEELGGRRLIDLSPQEFDREVLSKVPDRRLHAKLKAEWITAVKAGERYNTPHHLIRDELAGARLVPSTSSGNVRVDNPSTWNAKQQAIYRKAIDKVDKWVEEQKASPKNPNRITPTDEEIRNFVKTLTTTLYVEKDLWIDPKKAYIELDEEEIKRAYIKPSDDDIKEFKQLFASDKRLRGYPTTGKVGEENLRNFLLRKYGIPGWQQFRRQ